jgi:malonyl-CoA O-methyltransferase
VALEQRYLSPLLTNLKGKGVLDIACGTGRWMQRTHGQSAKVFGCDFSAEMIATAAQKLGLAGRLALADARKLPFASSWADVTLCALALGHISTPRDVIAELARVTRQGGQVILTDFHPEAVRRGWKRTFSKNGETYEIENHDYSVGELADPLLEIDHVADLYFDEPEREIFRQAGKESAFDEARRIPAVLFIRWRRL